MKKFNFDDYRVKDLDELVPLVKREQKGFDAKVQGYSYFVLGKDCRMVISYDRRKDEIRLDIKNALLQEKRVYSNDGTVAFESVDLNTIAENFLVFNHLVTDTSIFKRKGADPVKSHLLLTNVDKALAGEKAPKTVQEIVSAEEYAKAIAKAKKVFDREQQETTESQTPHYDI